jgi:HAD superfamily hydrolase (TIGR01509 family)
MPRTNTPQAKYILLDCDNTLCQSERLAFEACADLTNEVLEKKGKSKRYTTEELLEDFVGYNFRRMLLALQKSQDFSLDDEELNTYVEAELGRVTAKLAEKAVECPGVTEQLEWLKAQGYPMSVVSTSAKSRVVASIEKCNLDRFFPKEHVYSAATSLTPPSSKPDPAIYNFACKELGVKNEEAITVEDSKSGATAAMRANIPCIGYVGIYGLEDSKEKMEEMAKILKEETKCKSIMYDWKDFQKCLKEVEDQM